MKNRIGSNLFREKLNNVLNTPQGKQIKVRNNRISDKFQGGYLKGKGAGLKISLEPPAEFMDELATLTKMENDEKPVFKEKLPPSSFLSESLEVEKSLKPIYKESEDLEEEVEVESASSEEEDILLEHEVEFVNDPDIDTSTLALDVFKVEFNQLLENKDYFNALVVLITATLVVVYTFLKACAQELSDLVDIIIHRHINIFVEKEKQS